MVMKICNKCQQQKLLSEFVMVSKARRNATNCGYGAVCKSCNQARQKLYNEQNPEKRRVWQKRYDQKRTLLRYKFYGLTKGDFDALTTNQGGEKCAICGLDQQQQGGRVLSIDHDHNTGKVRGLLCNKCNMAIGALKDSIELLLKGAVYLMESEVLFESYSSQKEAVH